MYEKNETIIRYFSDIRLITPNHLDLYNQKFLHTGISFIRFLLQEKIVETLAIAQSLGKLLDLPFTKLINLNQKILPVYLLEEKIIKKYELIPLSFNKEVVTVGIVDPTERKILKELTKLTQFSFKLEIVDHTELLNLWSNIFRKPVSPTTVLQVIPKLDKPINDFQPSNSYKEDSSIIDYVEKLLQSALKCRVSDIHLEPQKEDVQIRFRIDGALQPFANVSKEIIQRVSARLKLMANLDITERRLPQDGRFQFQSRLGNSVDCRISTCPLVFGEKLVIRLMNLNHQSVSINNLGLTEYQHILFQENLNKSQGMILVTGPTGSGKTMTLYTALSLLNTSEINISSVEDPVEIFLPGINQVNVNSLIGLTFANVLRAFLRQDPDVIMLGEIRDHETAEIGINAAQTGHLVLSTLHTNSAIDTLSRLINLGISIYNITSAINLIIAQRLVRQLCKYCKVKIQTKISQFLTQEDKDLNSDELEIYEAKGCDYCIHGYSGRTGIFELLPLTDEIKNYMLIEANTINLLKTAQKLGFKTLYSAAFEKLKAGIISLSEFNRIKKLY